MEYVLLIILVSGLLIFMIRSRREDTQYIKHSFRPRPSKQNSAFDHALESADKKVKQKQKLREEDKNS